MRLVNGRIGMALAATLAGVMLGGSARATTLVVDDDNVQCPSAPFRTINAALAVANPGDDILVCVGTYAEQIVLTDVIPIRGLPVNLVRPVIAPTSTPITRPSFDGQNPVAAGIIVDAPRVRLENFVLDMTGHDTPACNPIITGIYLRNSSGSVVNVAVIGPEIPGRLDCDSGVGLLVESGQSGVDQVGRPIVGQSLLNVRKSSFAGFQKAGIAAMGPGGVLHVQGVAALGLGPDQQQVVQNAIQVTNGTRGKVRELNFAQIGTAVPGKLATGLLLIGDRNRMRAGTMADVQVGTFLIGNRNSLLKSQYTRISSDGTIIFGDGNRIRGSDYNLTGVDAIFLDGDQNVLSGVHIANTPLGLWNHAGMGNVVNQIEFGENVGERYRQGDVRDLSPDTAAPFTPSCASAAECDDGTVCNGIETCTNGTCGAGTALNCDDLNECTTDTCDPTAGCQHAPVTDGTLCTGGTCTGGLCS